MSADQCEALQKLRLSPEMAKAIDELYDAVVGPVTTRAIEQAFEGYLDGLGIQRKPVQEPVSHLLLGRSEPLPFERERPVPIPITNSMQPEVLPIELAQMLHEFNELMQDELHQSITMPASMMKERRHGW